MLEPLARYRDPKTGRVCRTLFRLPRAEVRNLLDDARFPGSMLREVDAHDFSDTATDLHPVAAESPANL
jgi:hypothetical protein